MKQAYVMANSKLFSSGIAPSFADIPDVLNFNYTEDFNQGLSDEEKKVMKRLEIYRSNPNDPLDKPKYVT